jgi:hypothetical protein
MSLGDHTPTHRVSAQVADSSSMEIITSQKTEIINALLYDRKAAWLSVFMDPPREGL